MHRENFPSRWHSSSTTWRRKNFAACCLFAIAALVAFHFANTRLEKKQLAGAAQATLRLQRIQRLERENIRLAEDVSRSRAMRSASTGKDDTSEPNTAQADRMSALREVIELQRSGWVSRQAYAYKHETGSTQNALNPIEPDFRNAGVAPAFVETFGLSPAEASELASAWRETKQKLEEATVAAVVSRMNADGSLTIEVKRPSAADFYLLELLDTFSRVLGPERFEILDGLMEGAPILREINGATVAFRPESRGGFDAYLSSLGGSEYTLTVTRRVGIAGEMKYQLATTIGKSFASTATDLVLSLRRGEWPEPLPPRQMKVKAQALSSRDQVLLSLGPLLGRFLPPDF